MKRSIASLLIIIAVILIAISFTIIISWNNMLLESGGHGPSEAEAMIYLLFGPLSMLIGSFLLGFSIREITMEHARV